MLRISVQPGFKTFRSSVMWGSGSVFQSFVRCSWIRSFQARWCRWISSFLDVLFFADVHVALSTWATGPGSVSLCLSHFENAEHTWSYVVSDFPFSPHAFMSSAIFLGVLLMSPHICRVTCPFVDVVFIFPICESLSGCGAECCSCCL